MAHFFPLRYSLWRGFAFCARYQLHRMGLTLVRIILPFQCNSLETTSHFVFICRSFFSTAFCILCIPLTLQHIPVYLKNSNNTFQLCHFFPNKLSKYSTKKYLHMLRLIRQSVKEIYLISSLNSGCSFFLARFTIPAANSTLTETLNFSLRAWYRVFLLIILTWIYCCAKNCAHTLFRNGFAEVPPSASKKQIWQIISVVN